MNPPPPPRTELAAQALGNGIALRAEQTEPPNRVFWLADDQVLVRWGASLSLISTETGAITPVEGYHDAVAASPDGDWVLYVADRWGTGWMVNVRSGERLSMSVPPAVVRWLSADLAVYGHGEEDGFGFVDLAGRTDSWIGTRMLSAVRLKTGAICYATPYGEYAICHPSPEARPLTLTGYRSGIAPTGGVPVPDPSGTRVALVDRLGTKPRSAFGFAGVAVSTEPLPPNPWVDTLAVYNAETGMVKRFPMPGAAFVEQILWSPDGAHIGLRLREGNTANGMLQNVSIFLVLDLTTGEWTTWGRVEDAAATLERVLPESLLIRRDGQLLELLADGSARPWQPEKQIVSELLPDAGPVSGIGRDLFLVSGQVLELHTAARDVFTWQLGEAKVAKASASPDRRWAGVLTEDNQLLLLRRD